MWPCSQPARIFAARLVLGVGLAGVCGAPAAASCHLGSLGTQHVEVRGSSATIEGSVNGQPIKVLVDTGSALTSLSRQFAQRASLDLHESASSVYGIGGRSNVYGAYIKALAFGPLLAKGVEVTVIADTAETPTWDGLLGADILFGHDLEMALKDGEIRVLIPDGCHDEFLAYWDGGASAVPMSRVSRTDHRQVITVQVNDRDVRALIDSGFEWSMIDAAAAARLGVTHETSKVLSEGLATGIGPRKVDTWVAPFRKIVIGRESITDTQLFVGDLRSGLRQDANTQTRIRRQDDIGYDMVLGADFLKAHRVLFAVTQELFYFSYVGGHIFVTDR
jgi:predicted aspartyl protease